MHDTLSVAFKSTDLAWPLNGRAPERGEVSFASHFKTPKKMSKGGGVSLAAHSDFRTPPKKEYTLNTSTAWAPHAVSLPCLLATPSPASASGARSSLQVTDPGLELFEPNSIRSPPGEAGHPTGRRRRTAAQPQGNRACGACRFIGLLRAEAGCFLCCYNLHLLRVPHIVSNA